MERPRSKLGGHFEFNIIIIIVVRITVITIINIIIFVIIITIAITSISGCIIPVTIFLKFYYHALLSLLLLNC